MATKRDGTDHPLDLQPLLTVADVARLLGFSRKGVYSLVEHRRIPFIKVSNRVRFSRTDVVAWLQENRVPAMEKSP
jgi:excisionase family DNA binding protein